MTGSPPSSELTPGPFRLRGRLRNYHWGSKTLLAELRGEPPSAEPEAELWYGTHEAAPSELELPDGSWCAFSAALAARPEWWLGEDAQGPRLPFLLKLLAASTPLSIQVHPSRSQAQAGFQREEGRGLARSDARRLYKDPFDKPEILRALGPFTALYGFRPRPEIERALVSLGLEEALPGDTVRARLERLVRLRGNERAAIARRVVDAAGEPASRGEREQWCAERQWVRRLAHFYPDDPWIIAPFLLNLVELEPGEALFTEAGVPHAYLEGLGVELMNNSDNVIRAGLTTKVIDQRELLRIVDSRRVSVVRYRSELDPRCKQDSADASSAEANAADDGDEVDLDGWQVFATPAREFELSELAWPQTRQARFETSSRLEILMAVRGDFEIGTTDAQQGNVKVGPTQAVALPAACSAYQVRGRGLLFRARSPAAAGA